MVRDYAPGNTFTWTPTASETGQYSLQVWVRNAGSTAAYDSYNGTPYFTITSSALAVSSLTASPALPQSYGVPITWTANTTGGTAPLQFQFWRLRSSTGVWSMVQNYSASNTFTWTPTASETGQYAIQVWVRNAGSTATYDAYNGTPYFSITGSAPTVSALTASPALPQRAGTMITWTATATGGTGPLQYQFWRLRSSTGVWTMVQNYSASNTFTWTPTASETGQYALQVWVRNAGSVAAYDAYNGTPYFTITP
jgi:subtilase family serine protease